MTNSNTLQKLQEQLGIALRDLEIKAKALDEARATYDKALALFHEQNPTVVAAKAVAEDNAAKAKEQVATLRAEAAKLLSGDQKLLDLPKGFEQTRDKVLDFQPDELLRACIQHFPWLLRVDEKALDSFVSKMAVEDADGGWALPPHIADWLPVTVRLEYKARISDSTILKAAPPTPKAPPEA